MTDLLGNPASEAEVLCQRADGVEVVRYRSQVGFHYRIAAQGSRQMVALSKDNAVRLAMAILRRENLIADGGQ